MNVLNVFNGQEPFRTSEEMPPTKSVKWIRIGCNADPDSLRPQNGSGIQMRIRIQGQKVP